MEKLAPLAESAAPVEEIVGGEPRGAELMPEVVVEEATTGRRA